MEASITAILLMAGIGSRLGSSLPKQFHRLGQQKIYQHTLQTFLESRLFEQIILVCHPDWVDEVKKEVPPEVQVVPGGPTRQASSLLGLQACNPGAEFVMVHDAVRPFVSPEILQRNISSVLKHRAVDTCIPSADTIVHSEEGTFITSIPDRKAYLRGQTPQTFDYQLIWEAHQKTRQVHATDDCSLVLELGHPVAVVLGEESNIKITTEFDVELAEGILQKNENLRRRSPLPCS
ncbi:MAG: 2-C-methyl-D-erythritol 4-phosphate cytidylyltransferase [Verrucomicrobia bacterium]|nr:2-C-methyl-D-erythritol 4-phosphate cytidylyltransferase [Verrucomicrobiota bacterium]